MGHAKDAAIATIVDWPRLTLAGKSRRDGALKE